ncbi:hypothetical protein I312_106057 [Cryptococcus bacillisporus CA1280]|uniref:uncharacterized protein n=1 Tax=Cryptococcus bacillisporus CA1280 TaxID=1296109 RepID=UPI003368232E
MIVDGQRRSLKGSCTGLVRSSRLIVNRCREVHVGIARLHQQQPNSCLKNRHVLLSRIRTPNKDIITVLNHQLRSLDF